MFKKRFFQAVESAGTVRGIHTCVRPWTGLPGQQSLSTCKLGLVYKQMLSVKVDTIREKHALDDIFGQSVVLAGSFLFSAVFGGAQLHVNCEENGRQEKATEQDNRHKEVLTFPVRCSVHPK